MAEYIELEAVIEKNHGGVVYIDDIKSIPAADVAPVRHGRWEYYDTYMDGITIFRCTCCGDFQSGKDGWGWKKNYCPNCGAKMRGESDE